MTTTTPTSHADQLPLVSALPVEHLFDMHVDLEPPQLIATSVGARMTFIANGGVIEAHREVRLHNLRATGGRLCRELLGVVRAAR